LMLRAGFEGLVADSKRYRDEIATTATSNRHGPTAASVGIAEAVA